eukprot:m.447003 g.447003  ORF g.447003 m.447003 type:complete len:295 (-) comp19460_c0_seq1:1717-2601(-)
MWRRKARRKKRPPTGAAAPAPQLTGDEDGEGDGPDEEVEDPMTKIEAEFPGWAIQDHLKEMGALKVEFQALAKKNYEQKQVDLDDKVKRINGGTDPEYKRRLIEIENDHKRAQAVLDARKEVQLACFDQLCQGEAYAAELTLAIDKERCKFLLIRKLTHPTPPETPDVDMPSEGDAEESEFYMEPFRPLSPSPATDEEGPPALLEAQGAMTEDEEPLAPTGVEEPMSPEPVHSMSPLVATPRSRKRSASSMWKNHRAEPVVYMLAQRDIDEDMMRLQPFLVPQPHYIEVGYNYS